VQDSTPDASTRGPIWEGRIHSKSGAQETNTPELTTLVRIDGNPQLFQRRKAIGHQAFAAGLVNRHLRAIGHSDAEALLARRNGRGQPCGTSANHKDISRVQQLPTSPL
jgi:hypothetical protein